MLGEKILKLRKQKRLSQEQLGEKINVTRQTISNWELGETSPNPEQLKSLSKELNVSIDELLDNEIKNILEEKVSNTEQLAGIIIKILKALGILFIIFVIVIIIVIIMFTGGRKEEKQDAFTSMELECSLDTHKYNIVVSEDNSFNCDGCSEKMINTLDNLTNTKSIDDSVQNIVDYFKNNGGSCE